MPGARDAIAPTILTNCGNFADVGWIGAIVSSPQFRNFST